MDATASEPMTRLIDSVLRTRRGNLAGGAALIVFSLVAFLLTRAIGPQLVGEQGLSSLWLPLSMALVSVPVFGAIALFFAGSGMGFPDGLRYGVITYAVLGGLLVLFGVPGTVPSGVVATGPFWPFFVLWFHPCLLGFGLWACPGV